MIEQVVGIVLQTLNKIKGWALLAAAVIVIFLLWGEYQNRQGYQQCRREVETAPKETTYVETEVRLPADSIAIEEYKAKLSKAQAAASRYRAQYAETARMYRELAARLDADSADQDSIPVTVATLDTVVQDKGDTAAVHAEYWYPPVNEFRNLYVHIQPRTERIEVPVVTGYVFTSPPGWTYPVAAAAVGTGGYFVAKENALGAVTSFAVAGAIYYFFMRE